MTPTTNGPTSVLITPGHLQILNQGPKSVNIEITKCCVENTDKLQLNFSGHTIKCL